MNFSGRVNYVCTNSVKINIVVPPYDKCKFKNRNIILIHNNDSFQPFTCLIKIRFRFTYLEVFPASIVILLLCLLEAS